MEVNVYFNGPATEIDMGPREFSVIPATGPAGPAGADGQPGRDGTIENLDVAATTLPAGSQATASYENNLLTLGIPEGEQGEDGVDGRGIVSITKQGSSGNIDTYKITYTSGAASTFEVTNGIDTSAIQVHKAVVGSGWSSSTWSSYARSAGAPSSGTCYKNTITVTGATGYDTFVARYMNGFTGVVYATVLDGQVMFETSINPTGQYAIDGILVKGKASGALYHTTQYVPGGGGALWGNITGTLSNQTDLQTALNAKADASAVYTKTETDSLLGGYIPIMPNAGFHNGVYRGKYLGGSVTAEQYAAISAGTFEDLFIGDYWTINGVNWRIAAFDYWYGFGDTPCTTHHVAIVPDSCLATGSMNSTARITGAYVGSDFYTGANGNTAKATAGEIINNAFSAAHVLSHRIVLRNAVGNAWESGGGGYTSTFELMTETMVYGTILFRNQMQGTNYASYQTIDDTQLPLFLFDRTRKPASNNQGYWLRDVSSANAFCSVADTGIGTAAPANEAQWGIRPIFGICA